MHNALEAYRSISKNSQEPRELEASLLLKAAAKLQKIKDNWDLDKPELTEALYYNRRLWTIFAGAMAEEDNQLPQQIKNNIASLAVFIMTHTLQTQSQPAAEKLNVLININREIAAGLNSSLQSNS